MNGEWKNFVAEWMEISGATGEVDRIPLAGDASNRQYFRIHFSGSLPKTAVLMEKNAGETFKKSEEAVSQSVEGPPGDPFILIDRFLREQNLPVPALLHVREDGSLILQEDFGDHTLHRHLSLHPEEEDSLTEAVLSLLVRLQGIDWTKGLPWLSHRKFGPELIRWEFEHFVEYGLAGASPHVLQEIRKEFDRESEALGSHTPMVPVHRDYHSRNIMVRENGGLGLIDFQDLLRGSPFYDLASFLFDPYRPMTMERISRWLMFYRERAIDAGILPGSLSRDECEEWLFRHAFQRNLKACGRFFYIADVKGNPSFLPSVHGTHKNLIRLSDRLPVLKKVHDRILPFLRRPSEEAGS